MQTPTEQKQEWTRANRRSDWICPRQTEELKSSVPSSTEVESSGLAERNAPTDLSAAGQVEVDEIAATLPCGQLEDFNYKLLLWLQLETTLCRIQDACDSLSPLILLAPPAAPIHRDEKKRERAEASKEQDTNSHETGSG